MNCCDQTLILKGFSAQYGITIWSIRADNGVYIAVNHWPKRQCHIFLRSYTYQQTKWLKDINGYVYMTQPTNLAPSVWHFSWAFPSRVTLAPHLCSMHRSPVSLHWAISQFHTCHEQPRQHFNPEPKALGTRLSQFIDSHIPKIWGLEKMDVFEYNQSTSLPTTTMLVSWSTMHLVLILSTILGLKIHSKSIIPRPPLKPLCQTQLHLYPTRVVLYILWWHSSATWEY
jgi:hypothetical protein